MSACEPPFTRVYIVENGTKYYLRNWVRLDGQDHVLFDTNERFARRIVDAGELKRYIVRMKALGYEPHIKRHIKEECT